MRKTYMKTNVPKFERRFERKTNYDSRLWLS